MRARLSRLATGRWASPPRAGGATLRRSWCNAGRLLRALVLRCRATLGAVTGRGAHWLHKLHAAEARCCARRRALPPRFLWWWRHRRTLLRRCCDGCFILGFGSGLSREAREVFGPVFDIGPGIGRF
ncbi:protein EXECUTER 2 [Dorcoceras hygrometricum]|uniref:Protein EXECUTER 2 n=1 Tax=Dorcoceras hygrometricum TaxID=472368 RepID=A0A2Z6ZWY3_9LAMI|nr:protein EXECUTER 2 [Dorcoceras hygrometricum]